MVTETVGKKSSKFSEYSVSSSGVVSKKGSTVKEEDLSGLEASYLADLSGDGEMTGVAKEVVSGTLVKGPLEKAIVFADLDGDGKLGPNEPSAETDKDGSYSFESSDLTAPLVGVTTSETVDKSSGELLPNVVLKAPAGSTVITPATTILEATPDIEPAQLAAALGIPTEAADGTAIDLTTFNPYAENADPAAALAAEKAAQSVMVTIKAVGAAAEGAGLSPEVAFEQAMASVTEVVAAVAETVVLPDSAASVAAPEGSPIADGPVLGGVLSDPVAGDIVAPVAFTPIDFSNVDVLGDVTDAVRGNIEDVMTESSALVTADFDPYAFNDVLGTAVSAVANVNEKINEITDTDLTSSNTMGAFALMTDLTEQLETAAEDSAAYYEQLFEFAPDFLPGPGAFEFDTIVDPIAFMPDDFEAPIDFVRPELDTLVSFTSDNMIEKFAATAAFEVAVFQEAEAIEYAAEMEMMYADAQATAAADLAQGQMDLNQAMADIAELSAGMTLFAPGSDDFLAAEAQFNAANSLLTVTQANLDNQVLANDIYMAELNADKEFANAAMDATASIALNMETSAFNIGAAADAAYAAEIEHDLFAAEQMAAADAEIAALDEAFQIGLFALADDPEAMAAYEADHMAAVVAKENAFLMDIKAAETAMIFENEISVGGFVDLAFSDSKALKDQAFAVKDNFEAEYQDLYESSTAMMFENNTAATLAITEASAFGDVLGDLGGDYAAEFWEMTGEATSELQGAFEEQALLASGGGVIGDDFAAAFTEIENTFEFIDDANGDDFSMDGAILDLYPDDNMGTDMGTGMGTDMGTGMGTGMGTDMGTGMGTDMGTGMGSEMGTGMGTDMGTDYGYGDSQTPAAVDPTPAAVDPTPAVVDPTPASDPTPTYTPPASNPTPAYTPPAPGSMPPNLSQDVRFDALASQKVTSYIAEVLGQSEDEVSVMMEADSGNINYHALGEFLLSYDGIV
jgi:hypothetical protein